MVKTDLKNIFDYFNNEEIKVTRIAIDGRAFNTVQLKILHDNLKNIEGLFLKIDITFKYKLSRRKGLIVILEEEFHEKDDYNFTDLNKYEIIAKSRFEIAHQNKSNLDTPTKVHPKKPCSYYNNEERSYQKRHYMDALSDLLKTPFHFFIVEKAIETLTEIYNEMLDDSAKTS